MMNYNPQARMPKTVDSFQGGVGQNNVHDRMQTSDFHLVVVHQSTDLFYKDEGGRQAHVQIDVRLDPRCASTPTRLPLHLQLMYENGVIVHNQEILTLVQPSMKPVEMDERGEVSLRVRIEEVSKNHRSQKFKVLVSADTSRLNGVVVAPALSNAIQVLSKRKDRKRKQLAAAATGIHIEPPPPPGAAQTHSQAAAMAVAHAAAASGGLRHLVGNSASSSGGYMGQLDAISSRRQHSPFMQNSAASSIPGVLPAPLQPHQDEALMYYTQQQQGGSGTAGQYGHQSSGAAQQQAGGFAPPSSAGFSLVHNWPAAGGSSSGGGGSGSYSGRAGGSNGAGTRHCLTDSAATSRMLSQAVALLHEAEWSVIGYSLNAKTGKVDPSLPIERCFKCTAVHLGGAGLSRTHEAECPLRLLLTEYDAVTPGPTLGEGAQQRGSSKAGSEGGSDGGGDDDQEDDDEEESTSSNAAGSSAANAKATKGEVNSDSGPSTAAVAVSSRGRSLRSSSAQPSASSSSAATYDSSGMEGTRAMAKRQRVSNNDSSQSSAMQRSAMDALVSAASHTEPVHAGSKGAGAAQAAGGSGPATASKSSKRGAAAAAAAAPGNEDIAYDMGGAQHLSILDEELPAQQLQQGRSPIDRQTSWALKPK